MAKHRKEGNEYTTISIKWSDKERLRRKAKFVKKTKNGDLYESDAVIFSGVLDFVFDNEGLNELGNPPHNTYPKKIIVSDSPLSTTQQG